VDGRRTPAVDQKGRRPRLQPLARPARSTS
jgi:hypothetical protein